MNRIPGFAKGLLALSLTILVAGCGNQKDLGEGLSIAVSPEKPWILNAPASSCADLVEAKSLGERAAESVSALKLTYSTFRLLWEPKDVTLRIIGITVTVSSPAIDKGEFSVSLGSTEIEALLGKAYGQMVGPVSINSSSTTERPASSAFAPCGLSIGGIKLAKAESQTSSFTANVTIEVTGTRTEKDGTETPVFKTTKAFAQFQSH